MNKVDHITFIFENQLKIVSSALEYGKNGQSPHWTNKVSKYKKNTFVCINLCWDPLNV